MAKPLPKLVIPPAASSSRSSKLSYSQLRALWIQAGGNPDLASTMAAIALAESHGDPKAHNDNAKTGDDSYGLWQINYFGNLRGDRTQAFGPSSKMSDPLTNARAAVALAAGGSGLSNWTTFNDGAYQAFFRPTTPQEKVANDTALANARASSPAFNEAKTQESLARLQGNIEVEAQTKIAKATAHLTDPWVTIIRGKGGKAVGFGQEFGASPPANALLIGGQPATQSLFNSVWGANYEGTFEAYTGRTPTAQDQADILSRGLSVYALRNELSKQPGFTSSPVYKETAAGINASAKQMLGTAPPPDLVRKAIAENWDAATLQANIRALPAYTKGPEFQQNFTAASDAYKSIYGLPNKLQNDWLKSHVVQGWTPDEIASKLRADPAYKYSPEYATKAINFLDAMGMFTGSRAIAAPAMPQAVKQASKGSPLGPLPNPFQVAEGGQ